MFAFGRLAVAVALALLALPARAQIATDGTVGARTSLVGPNYSIPNTLGSQVGNNLFHSFSTFNINTGQSATFSGPAGTANIITRVTGSSASNINGPLNSSIAGANFWFINPHGIAFGPNAQLNVGGSFHASTASYLRLGPSGRFDAANPSASNLTIDNPSAFGFLGTPAPITLDGSQLRVPAGQTLSFVGGPLTISGGSGFARLDAPGGRIDLAAASAPGEVTLGASSIGMSGSSAPITVSRAVVSTENTGAHAGPIFIRGGQLTMDTAALTTRNEQAGAGANINVSLDGDFSMDGSIVRSSAIRGGDAGDTTIRAANMTMTGGSIIETSSVDLNLGVGGRAGSTNIDATGDVSLSEESQITSISFFGPAAGELHIHARNLALSESAQLNASTFGDGAAGRVVLDVGNLSLTSGGNVLAGSLFDSHVAPGSGNGGDIVVSASGSVAIDGAGSGLFSITNTFGAGGTITVNAGSVSVSNGGRISTASSDPNAFGLVGNAGSIDVTAGSTIMLSNDGAITTESTTSGGGIINLHARDALGLTNSRITTSVADGTGNGGDINIDPVFVTLNSSQIIAQAVGGNGGDITIVTQFLIMSPDSIIDASSQFGLSGRVFVTAPQLDVASRLGVLTSAYVDPASRLRDSCAARAGAGNSFVGVGRGGLPASPQAAAFAGYAAVPMRQVGLTLPDPAQVCPTS